MQESLLRRIYRDHVELDTPYHHILTKQFRDEKDVFSSFRVAVSTNDYARQGDESDDGSIRLSMAIQQFHVDFQVESFEHTLTPANFKRVSTALSKQMTTFFQQLKPCSNCHVLAPPSGCAACVFTKLQEGTIPTEQGMLKALLLVRAQNTSTTHSLSTVLQTKTKEKISLGILFHEDRYFRSTSRNFHGKVFVQDGDLEVANTSKTFGAMAETFRQFFVRVHEYGGKCQECKQFGFVTAVEQKQPTLRSKLKTQQQLCDSCVFVSTITPPVETTSAGYRCNICFDGIQEQSLALMAKCGHIAHRGCFEKWKVDECPFCKTKPNTITRFFNGQAYMGVLEKEDGEISDDDEATSDEEYITTATSSGSHR